MIQQKSFECADLVLKNHFLQLSMLKTVVLFQKEQVFFLNRSINFPKHVNTHLFWQPVHLLVCRWICPNLRYDFQL